MKRSLLAKKRRQRNLRKRRLECWSLDTESHISAILALPMIAASCQRPRTSWVIWMQYGSFFFLELSLPSIFLTKDAHEVGCLETCEQGRRWPYTWFHPLFNKSYYQLPNQQTWLHKWNRLDAASNIVFHSPSGIIKKSKIKI